MTAKDIILIGLGPHAQRIYYPLLEKYAAQYHINIPLVIDLQDQQHKNLSIFGRSLPETRKVILCGQRGPKCQDRGW